MTPPVSPSCHAARAHRLLGAAVLIALGGLLPFSPRAAASEPDVMQPTESSAWTTETQPEFAAFSRWAQSSGRATADGVRLARERQVALLKLAKTDPARALADSVPAAVRAGLPAAVLDELETPFSAVGDFTSFCELRAIAGPNVPPSRFEIRFGGKTFPAHVYGRRAGMTSKQNVFLHGILVGNEAVLDENVLRVLSPAEAALETRTPRDLLAASTPASAAARPVLADGGGTLYRFASEAHVRQAEATLVGLESHRTPETADAAEPSALENPDSIPRVPDSAYTTGNKKVLVIRVDFSDLTGDPTFYSTTDTAAACQNIVDSQVAPYYVRSSFNQTSLTTTVTSQLYRMPRTAASYAQAGDNDGLHSDAETLAGADYNVSSYDRLIVVFSFLGNLSGSQIGYGGLAQVGGRDLWVNGEFDFRVVAHELGHTYGLIHANLWQVSDGNPISPNGVNTEYGDDFDTMGANFANTQSTDFNVWYKNQLDWVPSTQIKNVTASGTYRVYQFDGGTDGGTQALRIVKDGTNNYWVAIRRRFTSNDSMFHGVYLTWGRNQTYLNEELLDTQTPGTAPSSGVNGDYDAAVPLGTTFTDPVAGISIEPIDEGGTAPNLYEDVKIKVNANASAPAITSATSRSGTVGSAFTYQITATNSPTSYGASGLPTGLSVDTSSGAISGTPSQDGSFPVVISAFNASGTGSKTLTLTIAKSPNAPVITSFSPQSGAVGSTVTINGSNFSGVQYILFSGNAYAAASYTDTQITATVPSGAATGPITVATSNGSATSAGSFTVVPAGAPVITSATTLTATVGEQFTYQITATNDPTKYGVGGLFAGVTVDQNTGLITGKPTGTGTHSLTLRAQNKAGTGQETLTLTVKVPVPVINSATMLSVPVNQAFSYQITATNDPTRFGVGGLFKGVTVNSQTGVLSGTPTATGTHTLTLQAANAGGTGTKTLTLTVTP